MIGFVVKSTPRLMLYGFLLLSLAAPGGPPASAPSSNNGPRGSDPSEDYFVASPVTSYQFLDPPEEYFAASPVVSYQFFDAADQYFVASPIVSYQYLDSPSDLFTASAVVSYQYDNPNQSVQPQQTPFYCPAPTVTPPSHLWEWNHSNQFVAPAIGSMASLDPTLPTYILAPGWDEALDGQMVGESCHNPGVAMAAVGTAIWQAKGLNVNLLAWDWKVAANPNRRCDFPDRFTENLPLILLAVASPRLASAVAGLIAIDVIRDARASGDAAAAQGYVLAKALADEIRDHGELGSEVHLIGHSHGGALLGVAAQFLKQWGHPVDSITTLDTPNALLGIVNSLKYVDPTATKQFGHVAVFYYDDLTSGGVGQRIHGGPYPTLTNVRLNSNLAQFPDHSFIDNGWYDRSVWDSTGPTPISFNGVSLPSVLSVLDFPYGYGCYTEGFKQFAFTGGQCGQLLDSAAQEFDTPGIAVLVTDTFDDASAWSGTNAQLVIGADPSDANNCTILLTEEGDSSIYKDISWPPKSLEITFDYMFREPRGEESLTVYLNDDIVYYDNAWTSLATNQFRSSGPIYIGQAAGTTARLTFALRTDGTPGGSLVLDNLRTWGILPGDMNGDGKLDGLDIQPFITAVLAGSTDPGEVYIADFDSSGLLDMGDVDAFVAAIIGS